MRVRFIVYPRVLNLKKKKNSLPTNGTDIIDDNKDNSFCISSYHNIQEKFDYNHYFYPLLQRSCIRNQHRPIAIGSFAKLSR